MQTSTGQYFPAVAVREIAADTVVVMASPGDDDVIRIPERTQPAFIQPQHMYEHWNDALHESADDGI
jgi:hypothetical protein